MNWARVLYLMLLLGISSAQLLGQYNIDPNGISISGISSGACMASQMHVAFSDTFIGLGTVAGVFYYCAQGQTGKALQCMSIGLTTGTVEESVQAVRDFHSNGQIDDPDNLDSTKVFILQGLEDTLVDPDNADRMHEFYSEFMQNPDIGMDKLGNMGHGHPTENYGVPCPMTGEPYINDCSYHGAYEMLDFIYGNLQRPNDDTPLSSTVSLFEQRSFYSGGLMSSISMDTHGYVYVPDACESGEIQCKLHVALHGCDQGRDILGDEYVTRSYYNQVGELNNIIILYPQVITSALSPSNPQGCWDWWGYNDGLLDPEGHYASRNGHQTSTIHNMVQHMMG